MKWTRVNERFWFWMIFIVAAGVRLFQLGKRDFWYDEAFTGNMIRHSWSNMMREVAYDVHPPLHYLLLKSWAWIFGDSVFALRLFSLVCGVVSVGLVYLVGKELFGKRAGLFASFLTAIAPFTVQYSQENRTYALFGMCILLATFFFLRALRTGALRFWVGWGVSFALACLSHYMAFMFAPCFYVAWIAARLDVVRVWQGSWRERRRALRAFLPSAGFFVGVFSAFIVFLPWLSSFLHQFRVSSEYTTWKTPARLVHVLRHIQIFLFGTPKGEMSAWAFDPNVLPGISMDTLSLFLSVFLALVVASFVCHERRRGIVLSCFFFGFLFLVYALSFFDKHYFVSRYVFPSAFFFYLLLGAWLASLSRLRAGVVLGIYLVLLLFIQRIPNSEGYNAFLRDLPRYGGYHFYSLNTFDYVLAKYYVGPDRLTLYNVGWPQYDSRSWPGVGYETKRTENFEDVKTDPEGIVIWNTLFPLEQRDDRNFDTREFEKIATYKNIELYRSKRFVE